MRLVDLTGQRCGRLFVLRRAPSREKKTFWTCRCDCGKVYDVQANALRRGSTKSCGCLQRVPRTSDGRACHRPTRLNPMGRTGTPAGYLAHYYVGEDPCQACLDGSRDEQTLRRRDDPTLALRDNLWRKYRLSLERYETILASQDHKCAICRVDAPRDPRTNRFHVDHDHQCCPSKERTCGKCIRGLLCHACNTALGNFQDDPDRLRAAIDYLTRRPSESLPSSAVRRPADPDPRRAA